MKSGALHGSFLLAREKEAKHLPLRTKPSVESNERSTLPMKTRSQPMFLHTRPNAGPMAPWRLISLTSTDAISGQLLAAARSILPCSFSNSCLAVTSNVSGKT